MENIKTIKLGNWTISEIELQGSTLEELKEKFNYVDDRRVETAYKIANPRQRVQKKKKSAPSE